MCYAKIQQLHVTGFKGIRLKCGRRFSVQTLRSRLNYFFRHVLRSLVRASNKSCCRRKMEVQNGSSTGRNIVKESQKCSRGRDIDEVFYSEAIADCLEFIKRSSSVSDIEEDITNSSSNSNCKL
ncbi:hypothetical protein QQ045_024930 [Rhodiola kirilowii]